VIAALAPDLKQRYTAVVEPRRFRWRGAVDEHALVLAPVLGTSSEPYEFRSGARRNAINRFTSPAFLSVRPHSHVTQAFWNRHGVMEWVMGDHPSIYRDPRCPLENVSWRRTPNRAGFWSGDVARHLPQKRLSASEARNALCGSAANLHFRLLSTPTGVALEMGIYACRK